MNIYYASIICCLLWFVLKYFAFLFSTQKTTHKDLRSKIKSFARVDVLSYLSRFFMVGTISFVVMIALVWAIKLFSGARAGADYESSIQLLSNVASFSSSFNGTWTYVVLISLGFILITLLIGAHRERVRQNYEVILEDLKEGKLKPLAPDKESAVLFSELDQLQQELNDLVQALDGNEDADAKTRSEIDRVETRMEEVYLQYLLLETDRRMDEVYKAPPQDRKEVFARFFTGEGALRTFKAVSKQSSNLATVLLFLSLLSVQIGESSVLIKQHIPQVQEIHLNFQIGKIEEGLGQMHALSPNEQLQQLKAEDEQLIDELARAFELALAGAFDTTTTVRSAQTVAQLANFRSSMVRERVVSRYSNKLNTLKPGNSYTPHHVFDRNSAGAHANKSGEFATNYHKYTQSTKPVTQSGKEFRTFLQQEILKGKSRSWNTIKADLKDFTSSFGRRARPKDVLLMLLSESAGELQGRTLGKSTNLGKDLAGKLLKETTTEIVKSTYELKTKQFTRDLLSGKDFNAAAADASLSTKVPASPLADYVNNIKMSSEAGPVNFEAISQRAQSRPPSLDYYYRSHADMTNAQTSMKKLHGTAAIKHAPFARTEALATFADYFPHQVGAETRTPRGQLLSSIDNAQFPLVNYADLQTSTPRINGGALNAAQRAISRSRSFSKLRRFRRIGGVLIGVGPTKLPDKALNYTNLKWKRIGNRVQIYLIDKDLNQRYIGSFSQSSVYQAIAYAADGRQTTVTMTKANPFPYLSIMLHPSLVNTPLGCHAITLDRFVDTFASNNTLVRKQLNSADLQHKIYSIAVYHATLSNLQLSAYEEQYLTEQLKSEIDYLKYYYYWSDVRRILQYGKIFLDKKRSPLAENTENYNPTFVESICNCIENSDESYESFLRCTANQNLPVKTPEEIIRSSPEIWSGVRELSYEIDESLSFLHADSNPTWPFNFVEQVVYGPGPFGEQADESTELPWEFPILKERGIVNSLVLEGVRTSAQYRLVFKEMREFAILQRLFRAIFAGHLGTDFETEQILDLMADTENSMTVVDTPTWNVPRFDPGYSVTLEEYQQYLLADELQKVGSDWGIDQKNEYKLLRQALGVGHKANLIPCN